MKRSGKTPARRPVQVPAAAAHTAFGLPSEQLERGLLTGESRGLLEDYFGPESYQQLRDHIAFYPRRVDAAYLDDEEVAPQPGAYYGGWITEEIEGPFKGEPGSEGW